MEYIKSKYASFIFGLLNIIIYYIITNLLIGINNRTLLLGLFSFIIYYLFEVYNLEDSKYKIESFMITFWINLLIVLIISFVGFFNWQNIVIIYFIQLIFQVIGKFVILNFVIKNKNILIIGENYKNELIIKTIDDEHIYNYMGCITEDGKGKAKVLGSFKDISKIVYTKKISKIIITKEGALNQELLEKLLNLKLKGVQIFDYLTFYEKILEKVPVKFINEEWFLFKQGFDILHNRFQKNLKRIIDIFLAVLVFIPTLPIMILSALIIKLESKGSIFFIQNRIGEGEKPFKIVKFRSMKMHNPEEFSKYAELKDERITKFGYFMRKTRIDELPQLINIIKGDMSFVGPRAEWDKLCYSYMKEIPFYNLRHSVKPGLTGWAQVNYPYGASIEDAFEKLQYDLYYIRHQSLTMDILIFFKTIKTVLFGKGR